MPGLSNYLENEIMDALYGGGTFPAVTEVFLAFYVSDPGETGGGTELAGDGYARVALDPGTDLVVTAGTTTNAADIDTPFVTVASDVTVTHFALRTAASGGNALHYGELTIPVPFETGLPGSIRIPAGDLDLSVD